MAAIRHDKEDLSVDNVHTPFDLTKQRLARPPPPPPGTSRSKVVSAHDLEVMLRSVLLPMKACRTTTSYRTNQERNP